jgi:hypothetical protein
LQSAIPVERFGSYWSAQMLRMERTLRALDARVLSLRYERLLEAPERELERLATFVGVTADPRWIEAAAKHVRRREPSAAAQPAHVMARLERLCAPGMRVVHALAA